jgi:hypothetical protein
MNFTTPLLTIGISIALTTAVVCGEWTTAKDGSATSEQDGSHLWIRCDTEHGRALHPDSWGLILMFLEEPRASWKKSEEVVIVTDSDDGSHTIGGKSRGNALSPTILAVHEEDVTWELSVMANAKKSFTINAGSFSRTFSAVKLRETVAPVLEKCGDHW